MKLQSQTITRSLRTLVLLSVFAIATGCSTDSATKKSTAVADPVNEANHLTTAEVRKDPERIICRRHKPTGSRISEKICMTARQWQQASDDSQRVLDKAHRAPQAGVDQ